MTMKLGVSELGMLDQANQGDKVQFRAASHDGKLTVAGIQAAK